MRTRERLTRKARSKGPKAEALVEEFYRYGVDDTLVVDRGVNEFKHARMLVLEWTERDLERAIDYMG